MASAAGTSVASRASRASRASPLLGDQLCFALYSATLAMNKVYRRLLRALDVTYPQYLVLLVLWEEDARSVTAIGDRLYLDSATLTPLLKRMEANGLVDRARKPADEREVVVRLTKAGRALRRRASAVSEAVLCAADCRPEELGLVRDRLVDLRTRLLANA